MASDKVLGGSPARMVLVVGGPGSGKGILCDRLATECKIIHLVRFVYRFSQIFLFEIP